MSTLARYSRQVDGTIPVFALLYDDERLLASQDGVGLYDGPNKSPSHQSGTTHVTSHRIFFIANAPSVSSVLAPAPEQERGLSLSIELADVSHTESYAGFLRSSAKVTLHLRQRDKDQDKASSSAVLVKSPTPITSDPEEASTSLLGTTSLQGKVSNATSISTGTFDVWECEICGYKNPPGASPAARSACGLCGMPRTASTSATPSSSTPRLASPVVIPAPVPIFSSRSRVEALSGGGDSYLHSRSLPASSAHSPTPLSVSSSTSATPPVAEEPERRKRKPSTISCPACTFLNHPSLRECEICGTSLSSATAASSSSAQNSHPLSKSAPTSRPVSPDRSESDLLAGIHERERYVKLSFRNGGDKAFYAALKTALQQKAWIARETRTWKASSPAVDGSAGFSGIGGILQNIDLNATSAERGMSDAFADLEALMSKAQEMTRLAKDLNEQLTAASRNPSANGLQLEPEEATFVRSSLAQLGLSMKNTAVTSDMSNDEKKYLEQLAIELASVLESGGEGTGENQGFMRKRGIVGLDEVWGGWNRARGVSLISPEITLKALPYLPLHTHPPIRTRMLASGLRVLHTPAFSPSAFADRLVALIVDKGPRTTTQVATEVDLSVGLVDELIKEVENGSDICRDEPMSGIDVDGSLGIEVKWWANAFAGFVWDGQPE